MPKNDNENFTEYKSRVIDPVSSSFCAAKWLNSTIWLGSGTTASCHLPPAHRISEEEIRDNPSAIHNTIHKKVMRDQMLKGERPTECEYCWKIEDLQGSQLSDRVFKTANYAERDVLALRELSAKSDVMPKTLEIAFDRACNFACSYCNASFSTKWGADIAANGPYQNLRTDGGSTYRHNGIWADPFKDNGKKNPYVEAFWKWWPELCKSLEELRVTGGEPLLSQETWRLLDFFSSSKAPNLRLAINSNLGVPEHLIEKLIESSKAVPHLDIYTSCEALGDQAEYIRHGLKFEDYKRNIESIMSRATYRNLHMMLTINSLCLFSLPEFLDLMLQWKGAFGVERAPRWTLNILRFPSFMSPTVLPTKIRQERHQALSSWLEKNRQNPLISEFELGTVDRLKEYLDNVTVPHQLASKHSDLERDFKNFFMQYDQRRGKDFCKTFAPLATWFQSIDPLPFSYPDDRVDGDSTKGWHNTVELELLAAQMGLKYPTVSS